MKKCTKCLTQKEPSEFSKNKRSRDGLYASCKQCQKDGYVGLNLPEAKCASCGDYFKPRQKGSIYCSKKCRQRESEKLRVRPGGSGHTEKKGVCEWCEKPFVRKQRVVGKTCGMSCAAKLRNIGNYSSVYFSSCEVCGSSISAHKKKPKAKVTCKNCKESLIVKTKLVICLCCSREFTKQLPSKARCCSDGCTKELKRKSKRKSKSLRRAIKRNAAGGESFDPFEIFDRDNWRCQICGIETPKANRGTYMDNAPELDHIIPVSKGGLHTRLNTQCLCRKCNGEKSDKIIVK